MTLLRFPKPPQAVPCHNCTHPYAGAVCPLCKEERPAYTALKNMERSAPPTGVQPIASPLPACKYEPKALCDCQGRGLCLDVA